MSEQTILAIDFGTRRIGVAISRGSLAEPLSILENDEQTIAKIQKIIEQEMVKKIVLGISENEMAEKTRQFATQIRKTINLPLDFFDETLSSYTVHQKLQTASKTKRGQPVDHYAAAEFLQEYLDS